jgi:hypothetical protein
MFLGDQKPSMMLTAEFLWKLKWFLHCQRTGSFAVLVIYLQVCCAPYTSLLIRPSDFIYPSFKLFWKTKKQLWLISKFQIYIYFSLAHSLSHLLLLDQQLNMSERKYAITILMKLIFNFFFFWILHFLGGYAAGYYSYKVYFVLL